MSKKLTQRGKHVGIPIVGDKVAEVCLKCDRHPEIVFRDTDGNESSLEFEQTVHLTVGAEEPVEVGTAPGALCDGRLFAPLADLLGSEVSEAIAEKDGTLRIGFSNGAALRVQPKEYEGWHFQYPRAARAPGGPGPFVSLHGTDGNLI
jgi:hypothetical protein